MACGYRLRNRNRTSNERGKTVIAVIYDANLYGGIEMELEPDMTPGEFWELVQSKRGVWWFGLLLSEPTVWFFNSDSVGEYPDLVMPDA